LNEESKIKRAFPSAISGELIELFRYSLMKPTHTSPDFFSVVLKEEELIIPGRIYYDETALEQLEPLSAIQKVIVYCLFSRHHNGFTRQKCISKIISSQNEWSMPFIVQIIGEYVIEILNDIFESRNSINKGNLKNFVLSNRELFIRTRDRVASYWDCYYRTQFPKKETYVGFKILAYIDHIVCVGSPFLVHLKSRISFACCSCFVITMQQRLNGTLSLIK
jgi:hypothetical protein